VHPVGRAEQGDIDVVVDDEERARPSRYVPDPACQLEQLAPSQGLVAQLKDVRSASQRSGCKLDDMVGRRVGSDDVEVSGEEPL
jgi:hypothetical protein